MYAGRWAWRTPASTARAVRTRAPFAGVVGHPRTVRRLRPLSVHAAAGGTVDGSRCSRGVVAEMREDQDGRVDTSEDGAVADHRIPLGLGVWRYEVPPTTRSRWSAAAARSASTPWIDRCARDYGSSRSTRALTGLSQVPASQRIARMLCRPPGEVRPSVGQTARHNLLASLSASTRASFPRRPNNAGSTTSALTQAPRAAPRTIGLRARVVRAVSRRPLRSSTHPPRPRGGAESLGRLDSPVSKTCALRRPPDPRGGGGAPTRLQTSAPTAPPPSPRRSGRAENPEHPPSCTQEEHSSVRPETVRSSNLARAVRQVSCSSFGVEAHRRPLAGPKNRTRFGDDTARAEPRGGTPYDLAILRYTTAGFTLPEFRVTDELPVACACRLVGGAKPHAGRLRAPAVNRRRLNR